MKWVPYFLFLVFSVSFSLGVVDVQEIQKVRQRTESATAPLGDADKAETDKFLLAALNDIFLSKSSEEMAKTRRQILDEKGTKDLSMYATTYITLLREHLRSSAYEAIQRIEDPIQRILVRRNLIILVAELHSLLLVEFGLERIEDSDAVIRYWAVKSLASNSIAEQLNSEVTANPEAADQIYEKLQIVIQNEKQPEILALVADFGASWMDERAIELLRQMTAHRIKKYQDCSIAYEWVDGRILDALAGKYQVQKLPDEKAKTARSFAELLAVVMQRYMQGKPDAEGRKAISDESIYQLVTVIVETEERIFPRLEIPAAGIKRTIERDEDLQPLFDGLFGTTTRKGTLRTQMSFEYSPDASGNAAAGPPTLSPCTPAGSSEAGV